MLSKVSLWSPSKLNQKGHHDHEIKKRSSSSSSVNMSSLNLELSSMAVGLRILTAETKSIRDSNVVINSGLKLIKPIFRMNPSQYYSGSCSLESCFLKSCFLCNKNLSLDKDVYMYRGDQGFCSVECRSRQIYLDEMREIENSTKQTLASFRRCRDSKWCDAKNLLEEFRQRNRQPMSYQKGQNLAPIFILHS